ncbi:crossover junction endodeoxyribonuclease RuvC [candidate division WWE3 bacterium RIFOXYC2_FULL_42_13]|uniref:Crossover junction endodeoxyribonuclease RuvC n=1 Tax=candidate division WWE3 bacterium TaxID=2053526 RepID=A0A3D0ZQX4_UNCKA|nr:MAG: crossover junction endodeoxyribonuclease RuvC [candidate division WWE3 bacterium RIFOXYA2_FULL_43_12]OGC65600.1 MAG: crossover junction endodeoxyribonuclease RuvC [candidate division WWE3 bacterium RIFOXYA12_FULL_43_11]OGC71609.1 MAG: crossover junction endodeoxyribonuclease RuvC [candidate division WWE3 bacterium RIFOXYB2_FULL_43_9]OGC72841.1 MAG: crossover junction endodeoxyribonuclease RuvC [candidate division WWE3 bacterium RIFOXYC2_FULL_42_13]OGC74625.1 MAG: crossover junction endo
MVILGIDPGTARLGYGVIKEKGKSGLSLSTSGVLVTAKELELKDRLLYLYENLLTLINKYSPDIIVVERIFFNTNAKTAIAVGQARGVILLAAASTKTRIHEYTALEAKLILTGYGRSDKKVMQEAVKNVLGLECIVKSDDANDAVAMALCYIKKGESRK